MVTHVDFGSIGQFRQVIKAVKCHARYLGKDANGEAIYDPSLPLPVITFEGTVKLHGSNSAVAYDGSNFWVQLRNRITEVGDDNLGFAAFVHERKAVFIELLSWYVKKPGDIAVLYLEWAGKGVQSGVALNNIPKSCFILGLKVTHADGSEEWFNLPIDREMVEDDPYLDYPSLNIYNIWNFPTYSIDIDFNYPELAQNRLAELTKAVGAECPVAKEFGFRGNGEGIVWIGKYNGQTYRFKVKDERHSVTKVKTLAPVDVELVASIQDFVEYAVTPQRVEQAISEIGSDDRSLIGGILRWVVNDIWKEEADTLVANGLVGEQNKVNKAISNKAREIYFGRTTGSG